MEKFGFGFQIFYERFEGKGFWEAKFEINWIEGPKVSKGWQVARRFFVIHHLIVLFFLR
jgi:hypothetical protein